MLVARPRNRIHGHKNSLYNFHSLIVTACRQGRFPGKSSPEGHVLCQFDRREKSQGQGMPALPVPSTIAGEYDNTVRREDKSEQG
jgi:hypothetical protein